MQETLRVHLTTFLISKHNKVIRARGQISSTKYYDHTKRSGRVYLSVGGWCSVQISGSTSLNIAGVVL